MPTKRTVLWAALFLMIAIGLYAVSFGPYLFLKSKVSFLENETAGEVTFFVFRPHFYAMYRSRWYYDYCCWFADIESSELSHLNYRRIFHQFGSTDEQGKPAKPPK